MRDDVTVQRRLSLVEPVPKMIPDAHGLYVYNF